LRNANTHGALLIRKMGGNPYDSQFPPLCLSKYHFY